MYENSEISLRTIAKLKRSLQTIVMGVETCYPLSRFFQETEVSGLVKGGKKWRTSVASDLKIVI